MPISLIGKPDNVTLIRDYDPSLPELAHDPDQIEQVLLNITRNALQALGETGGTITLRTRTAFQVTLHGMRYRLAARIDIEDDGPGVPTQLQDTVFYPMVSGREGGTGLGLSIARNLIDQHSGKIEFNSWPGHTEFRFTCLFASEVSMQRGIVWIVDDDSSIRWVLERALTGAGLNCVAFDSGNQVLDALATRTPDVLLSDIRMPGMDGLALLKQIKQRHPMLPVIIMTAHSDLDAAVSAYQQGAFDYLPKPFDIDEAVALVERAISHYQEQQQPARSQPVSGPTADIIGEAPAMQDVFRIIGRLSRSSISVLINGESGTGKELVAHALHRHSPRAKALFIALNMAAIPKDLIESELFGHEKGHLPGPIRYGRGALNKLTPAHFLDEIGDMPLDVQTRLLRVLADGQFYRVGGYAPVKVDVRIIAATHQNLELRVQEGNSVRSIPSSECDPSTFTSTT